MENKAEECAQHVAKKIKEVKKRKVKSCGGYIKKFQHVPSGSHRRESENGGVGEEN